jgi:predicted thioesterase
MRLRVTDRMTARFFDCGIHPLYATFALIEHAEYASRQVILPFLDREEDAVGAAVAIEHFDATPVGWIVEITARLASVEGRSITCEIEARNRHGVIARGTQRQRVVSREKLQRRIAELQSEPAEETGS